MPNALASEALRAALSDSRDHVEVVRLLLADRRSARALPSAMCLRQAAERGHIETVRLLLIDGRPEQSVCAAIDWSELAFKNCRHQAALHQLLLLAHPACWIEPPRSEPHRRHDHLTKLVDSLSPVQLRSLGIDWRMRHPLPASSVWLPTQQRLVAWAQFLAQLDEDEIAGQRESTCARFVYVDTGFERVAARLEELMAWCQERDERRLWLRKVLPLSIRSLGRLAE